MQIIEIESDAFNLREGMRLDLGATEAFPYLRDSSPTSLAYSWPKMTLECATHWSWLEWHRTHRMDGVVQALQFVVHRGRDVNRLAANRGLRDLHDLFLLQVAVLSGSKCVADEAAELVGNVDVEADEYPYRWGLGAIYRGSIIGDEQLIRAGYRLVCESRPAPPYRVPTEGVLKAFVERDEQSLRLALKRLWKSEWLKLDQRDKGVVERTSHNVRVSLRERIPSNLWPWPEVALAKLALRLGMEIPTDELWCPEGYVRSFFP